MQYFLDGYNLLFALIDSSHSLASQRSKVVRFLQKKFASRKISGLLVFDGKVRHDESGRSYPSPLEVIYTHEGQSADDYITERITLSKNPRQITVVTNDRELAVNSRALRAKSIDNTTFVQWLLQEKKPNSAKPCMIDTKQNLERLLKIFEDRL